ncbi:hypothetical protein CIRMBP1286_00418 [Enterococcus cecorum]|nr:hypothetical protein CIRMBP1268_00136 [Enterococcus cecorum]CAI3497864.1 hypothetical protein CIRMBP1286_00418 [Enterococcus cecorum]
MEKSNNQYARRQNILTMINITACVYSVIWMINPIHSNINAITIAIAIWILSAICIRGRVFYRLFFSKSSVAIWLWPLVMIFYSIWGHMEFSFSYFIYMIIGFMIPFYLLDNNYFACKVVAVAGIGYCLIISVVSIGVYSVYPNISRVLSYGSSEMIQAQGLLAYKTPFIADYRNIYILIFLILALMEVFRQADRFRFRILLIGLMAIFTLNLILGQFSISYVLMLLGIAGFFVVNTGNKKQKVMYIAMLMIGAVLLMLFLKPILLEVGELLGGNVQMHMKDFVDFLDGSENTALTSDRILVYSISLESILEHPVFGAGSLDEMYVSVGNHSSILDTFARFGILGSVPYLYTIIVPYRWNYRFMEGRIQTTYRWCYAVFILSACVNVMFNYHTLCMILVIIPALFASIYKKD